MSATEPAEYPPVSTEPQRQALDEMSQELLRKLNTMVEEQNERARQFASTEHSLSSKPMEFDLSLPEAPGAAGTLPSVAAFPEPSGQGNLHSSWDTPHTTGRHTSPPPPPIPSPAAGNASLPGFPAPSAPTATPDEQAARRRAEILQRQREQRRAEQEAEEQRRERIRQAQQSVDSIGSLLEFLGQKKAKATDSAAAPHPPEPAGSSTGPAQQPERTQSCGCTTLFIVIATILIILKVVASMD